MKAMMRKILSALGEAEVAGRDVPQDRAAASTSFLSTFDARLSDVRPRDVQDGVAVVVGDRAESAGAVGRGGQSRAAVRDHPARRPPSDAH